MTPYEDLELHVEPDDDDPRSGWVIVYLVVAVALVLRRAARAHRSATLEANAQHLLTDVWTREGGMRWIP